MLKQGKSSKTNSNSMFRLDFEGSPIPDIWSFLHAIALGAPLARDGRPLVVSCARSCPHESAAQISTLGKRSAIELQD